MSFVLAQLLDVKATEDDPQQRLAFFLMTRVRAGSRVAAVAATVAVFFMISMWKMREMVDKATNLVMNYTETEAKVREATNDDPWGPSGNQMQELASFTFTYEQFPEVMGIKKLKIY